MRLRQLVVKNFRKIEDLTINFPKGLSVIIGENNVGKTAIIDALRIMLFSSRDFDTLRLNEDDYRRNHSYLPIEISCTFSELKEDDEVHFQECLVEIEGVKFEMRLNLRAEFNEKTRKSNIKTWGGETEGGTIPSNFYDRLTSVYLQPLRDPEVGLRPGRYSQISKLLNCLTKEEQHEQFEAIVREANEQVRSLGPVDSARNDINSQLTSITGPELTQKTELVFSDPAFHRIIAGLHPEIEGLPFALNGLGYNNLVFTSVTLGTLKRSSDFSFRSILIEEPEAHLHPQLQVLLLRHLAKVAAEKNGNEVQVIASSHSPILASQAPIDSIISIHTSDNSVKSISVCSIEMDRKLKNKLERYLDATRAELFFARRLLMVEGISEVLIVPVLAAIAGGCLKESSVTLLNTAGINFNAFLPLFGKSKLEFPTVILTDGDAKNVGGQISATTLGLKELGKEIANLRIEHSEITFEHELARSEKILPLMLKAFSAMHPRIGRELEADLQKINSDDEKATAFIESFIDSETSKGAFAQELVPLLKGADLKSEDVPQYVRNALSFLSVIRL